MGEEIKELAEKWRHWKFKNTGLLLVSLLLFFFFAEHPFIRNSIEFIGNFGYIGAFIAGILFVSIFTVAPATVVLFYLADTLNPLGVALTAGLGCVLGDYLIFRYLKDRVFEEIKPLFINHGGKPLRRLFKTPYFAWIIPFLGAFIIMSPFPDEVGLGLLGLSKIQMWKLLLLLFLTTK
jgi:membrane protein YqaA with SNARE-associated domain